MIYIIGTGLSDGNDISVKGLEAIKSCSKIYLEIYTSKLNCEISELEKNYGKTISSVDREFVEDGTQILSEAKENNVALLIIGDPLSATTHWDLLTRAKKENIQTLEKTLLEKVGLNNFKTGNTVVTNSRHYESLVRTKESLLKVIEGIETGITNDFVAMDIRQSLHYLGEITGQITTDDLLETIFSKFCIGK